MLRSIASLLISVLALSACDDNDPATDACTDACTACDAAAADRGTADLAHDDLFTDVDSTKADSGAAHDSSIASSWVGGACGSDSACQAHDPGAVCLTGGTWVWTGGYCSITCDPTAKPDTCPTGSHCEELAETGPDLKTCIKDCLTKADCRAGYICAPIPGTSTGGCLIL